MNRLILLLFFGRSLAATCQKPIAQWSFEKIKERNAIEAGMNISDTIDGNFKEAVCDGRTSKMSDRPSHCDSFPISDPVINENSEREWWNGLYGMTGMSMTEMVSFGRSWEYAPVLCMAGTGFKSSFLSIKHTR